MSAFHRKKYNQEPKSSLRTLNVMPYRSHLSGVLADACCLASTGAWKQIPSVVLQWGFVFRRSV